MRFLGLHVSRRNWKHETSLRVRTHRPWTTCTTEHPVPRAVPNSPHLSRERKGSLYKPPAPRKERAPPLFRRHFDSITTPIAVVRRDARQQCRQFMKKNGEIQACKVCLESFAILHLHAESGKITGTYKTVFKPSRSNFFAQIGKSLVNS